MTTQLLAQALATAANPDASLDQLGEVVGDLIRFGAFDAADSVLKRLREGGRSAKLVERMQRLTDRLRDAGPDFEDRFLLRATALVNDPDARPDQLLRAAESLIIWGSLDEADRALERLKSSHGFSGRVNRLAAASHQLRRSGILQELKTLKREQSLNKPHEVLIRRRAGADRAIIVFTGAERRFWLSLNVLHQFLRRLNAHVIYLGDHSGRMYVNGLTTIEPGYDALVRILRAQLDDLGVNRVHVMAMSAGGFVGLRAAKDLKAAGFAGTGIKTTLDRVDGIATGPYIDRVINDCRYPEMLGNLRHEIAASEFPRRILLYCGDLNTVDRAHAENLSGIERVEVHFLTNYRPHNVVSGMVARGQFLPMLQRLMADPAEPGLAVGNA